jgi:hypothetical protein
MYARKKGPAEAGPLDYLSFGFLTGFGFLIDFGGCINGPNISSKKLKGSFFPIVVLP